MQILKKQGSFFDFIDFEKFIPLKNDGNVNFAENLIYLQILMTYSKRNEHF